MPKQKPQPPDDRRRSWSFDDILRAEFPELQWLVQDLLPGEGLTILAGRPKVGKSALALQLALAVSTEQTFLDRATSRCPVLCYALEDSERRVQDRLLALGAQAGDSAPYRSNWIFLPSIRAATTASPTT